MDKNEEDIEHSTIIDLKFYIEQDSYVHDSISPIQSDAVMTIVRMENLEDKRNTIYFWEYSTFTFICKQQVNLNVNSVYLHPRNKHQYVIVGDYFLGVINILITKKKSSLEVILEQTENKIADVSFADDHLNVAFINCDIWRFDDRYSRVDEVDLRFQVLEVIKEKQLIQEVKLAFLVRRQDQYFVQMNKPNLLIVTDLNFTVKYSIVIPFEYTDSTLSFSENGESLLIAVGQRNFKKIESSSLDRNQRSQLMIERAASEAQPLKKKGVHSLSKVVINYLLFKKDSDKFIFSQEILKNSSIAYSPKFACVSTQPDRLHIYFSNRTIHSYKVDWSIKISEDKVNMLPDPEINFDYEGYTTVPHDAINIAYHPLGHSFFVSCQDRSFYYLNVNQEMKETLKVNNFCRGAAFSKSGLLLAYSMSDSPTSFAINIINTATFEVRYLISNISSQAVKIEFINNDNILIAFFEDNFIFAWHLRDQSHIVQSQIYREKVDYKITDNPRDEYLLLRNTDTQVNIVDFVWDNYLDYLLVTTSESKVKIFDNRGEGDYCDFKTDKLYTKVKLLREIDTIIFGTKEGDLHAYRWPIVNLNNKYVIDTPVYHEVKCHTDEVTDIVVNYDKNIVYSTSIDGSIVALNLRVFINEKQIRPNHLQYFSSKNKLKRKDHNKLSDFIFITKEVYTEKIKTINGLNAEIKNLESNYRGELEKKTNDYSKSISKKNTEVKNAIEVERRKVMELEISKESLSKVGKRRREEQSRKFREEKKKLKEEYKTNKTEYQKQTKKLEDLLEKIKSDFEGAQKEMGENIERTNITIMDNFKTNIEQLQERLKMIEAFMKKKKMTFHTELSKIEEEQEEEIQEIEKKKNEEIMKKEQLIKDKTNDITKINKTNTDNNLRIEEWNKNLRELNNNNNDLMEIYLYNTLKLKQLNKILKENESKITSQETEVKEKRIVNDRLEKLKFLFKKKRS